MTNELIQIFTILQSKKGGASSRGISYWSRAARCGRLANLAEKYKMDLEADDENEALDAKKPMGRIVGSHFHTLQQAWHEGQLPGKLAVEVSSTDIHFAEAVRCIHVYQAFWPREYFGKAAGCEVGFPSADDERALLRDTFGDDFTWRVDRIVELSEADVEKIEGERGVILNGPGRYFIDYKLLFQIKGEHTWEYQFGAQAQSYPLAYNILAKAFPDRYQPVKGMIFDVMSRQPQKLETFGERHFKLFTAQYMDEDVEWIRAAILKAKHDKENDIPNPLSGCFGKYGDVCPFLKNSACDRK